MAAGFSLKSPPNPLSQVYRENGRVFKINRTGFNSTDLHQRRQFASSIRRWLNSIGANYDASHFNDDGELSQYSNFLSEVDREYHWCESWYRHPISADIISWAEIRGFRHDADLFLPSSRFMGQIEQNMQLNETWRRDRANESRAEVIPAPTPLEIGSGQVPPQGEASPMAYQAPTEAPPPATSLSSLTPEPVTGPTSPSTSLLP